jgi:2-oxoglutarate ferredoxin oxidoreductase subunit alpha
MTYEALEQGADFGRYLDVDGDGIPYRTLPGTHPTRGGFFTRGTTRDAYARYSEQGADYTYNMERLLRKFETARELVPQPIIRQASQRTTMGVIFFGSTSPAMSEAIEDLAAADVHVDTLRLRAFPFAHAVEEFIKAHDRVFVVEQNRDAQLRTLLINELEINPEKLIAILHYDGTPITGRFIMHSIASRIQAENVVPIKKGAAAS